MPRGGRPSSKVAAGGQARRHTESFTARTSAVQRQTGTTRHGLSLGRERGAPLFTSEIQGILPCFVAVNSRAKRMPLYFVQMLSAVIQVKNEMNSGGTDAGYEAAIFASQHWLVHGGSNFGGTLLPPH